MDTKSGEKSHACVSARARILSLLAAYGAGGHYSFAGVVALAQPGNLAGDLIIIFFDAQTEKRLPGKYTVG